MATSEDIRENFSVTSNESGIGALNHEVAVAAAQSALDTPHEKRQNKKFTEKDRYLIGKYASENGTAAAQRKFRSSHNAIGESTIRSFKNKYEAMIKDAARKKVTPKKAIVAKKRGRPVLLGEIDEMVQRFLLAVRRKGGVVNAVVARSVAKALVKRSGKKELEVLDLDGRWWIQSLFRRMNFVRRTSTTSKVEIPDGAKKEAELTYLHKIVSTVEKYKIPNSMILNLDQTPLKYAPCSRQTLAPKNSKHVAISGSSNKESITGTFVITLDRKCLPFQLIYGGKTTRSLPKFKFPEEFSLSVNEKHFSNTQESLKILREIVIPYIEQQRKENNLSLDHPALLILDVFRGQLTNEVVNEMKEHDIFMCQVPANMTHLFQPLDLTVNGSAKAFLKAKFTEWFSQKVEEGLNEGKELEDIDIKLTLSVLKPLHASWVGDLYNYLTSIKGKVLIENGWKTAGITKAIEEGYSKLPPLDPFESIDPLMSEANPSILSTDCYIDANHLQDLQRTDEESDEETEWEHPDFDNIFDIFDDEA